MESYVIGLWKGFCPKFLKFFPMQDEKYYFMQIGIEPT